MGVVGFELFSVATEYVTADFIIWKRFLGRAPGMFELMLDANPQLSMAHRRSPFIPVGVYVRVPIDPNIVLGKPRPLPQDSLWTDAAGYRLRGEPPPTSMTTIIEKVP